MRFVRYQQGNAPPVFGWVHEEMVGPVEGNPFEDYRRLEATLPLRGVKLLPPIEPGKIIGILVNYAPQRSEDEPFLPELPVMFMKPGSSVVGNESPIVLPLQSQLVIHEAELGVIIGKKGRWINPDDVQDYIFGYTICNDVTAVDLMEKDFQIDRSKSFDTFCPIGPWVETELDPTDILITCRVNEEMRQMASTREMVFTIPQLIAFVSSVMTLNPGDVLITGSPAGSEILSDGDVVEISIEGIGVLRNTVVMGESQ